MQNGEKETKGRFNPFVLIGIVLGIAAVVIAVTTQNRAQKNSSADAHVPVEQTTADGAAVSSALSELTFAQDEEPEADSSSKEIVKDVILSNVPKADFSNSFNGKLGDAAVVVRAGDVDGFNEGTYPEQTQDVLPLFTEGVEGEAVYLDGTYGVELLGVDTLSDSYTIAFWFRADELCDWSPFLVIGSHLLDVGETQSFLSLNKKTTEEGTQVVPVFNTIDAVFDNSCEIRPSMEDKRCISLNVWNYITVCVDASQRVEEDPHKVTGYLYVNSELIGSGAVSKLHLAEDVQAYLGINCFDELFRASFDEIHIWNQVLTESQINSMYTAYTGTG